MYSHKSHSMYPVVILLGGKGSRFSELNKSPKQLVKLNRNNLIIAILNYYNSYNFNYFLLPLGYKKEFFYRFFKNRKNQIKFRLNILNKKKSNFNPKLINIELFDTKKNATKLERIKKSVNRFDSQTFFVTYGDGLANINFKNQLSLYKKQNKNVVTIYKIRSQYGHFVSNNSGLVKKFEEKPYFKTPINIGYYIFNKIDFNKYFKKGIELEQNFIKKLIKSKLLISYNHGGFFFNIDNKKDLDKVKKDFKGI